MEYLYLITRQHKKSNWASSWNSAKIGSSPVRLTRRKKICLHSVFTDENDSNTSAAETVGACFNCIWFQQCKHGFNLIQPCLLLFLFNERVIEPASLKEANQFFSFKVGDNRFLYIMKLHGAVTYFDSFLKAFQNSETSIFSHTKSFITPRNCKTKNNHHMTHFTVDFAAIILLKHKTMYLL